MNWGGFFVRISQDLRCKNALRRGDFKEGEIGDFDGGGSLAHVETTLGERDDFHLREFQVVGEFHAKLLLLCFGAPLNVLGWNVGTLAHQD